eukprot:10457003-Alexandrium_andersonii.AAC.1
MKAMDCVSGQHQVVPFADGFAMGFSCTSRSPANRNAKAKVNCIQTNDPDAATNVTFRGGLAYVDKARPFMILMENVKELDQKVGEDSQDVSDAQAVVDEFEELGYVMAYHMFDAADYGSWAHRKRIYFFGFHGRTSENEARIRSVKRFFFAMEIGHGHFDSVILLNIELEEYLNSREAAAAAKKPK